MIVVPTRSKRHDSIHNNGCMIVRVYGYPRFGTTRFRVTGRSSYLPAIAALAAAVLAISATPAFAAKYRHCGSVGFAANSDAGAFDIRARNTRCSTARSVARSSEQKDVGGGDYRYTARGFACRGKYSDATLPVVKWTCVAPGKRVIFTQG